MCVKPTELLISVNPGSWHLSTKPSSVPAMYNVWFKHLFFQIFSSHPLWHHQSCPTHSEAAWHCHSIRFLICGSIHSEHLPLIWCRCSLFPCLSCYCSTRSVDSCQASCWWHCLSARLLSCLSPAAWELSPFSFKVFCQFPCNFLLLECFGPLRKTLDVIHDGNRCIWQPQIPMGT